MIICPTQGFVFVHIPKCAGSSVRSQVRRCDADHVSMGDVAAHPSLGRIDYGHVPLGALRAHFPDEYAAVRDLTAFAVLRDPLARFGSALRQVLWRYEGRPMTAIPPAELRETTLRMLDDVAADLERVAGDPHAVPSRKLVFFARQEGFVSDLGLEGHPRLVDHALPMELVPDLIDHLARRSGVALDPGARANQNVDLKVRALGGPAYAINSMLRRMLPERMHARVKAAAIGMLSSGRSAADASGVLDLPEVRDFVDQHYAADVALHAAARAETPALKAMLSADATSGSGRPVGVPVA
ncbi:sulfotransferase family protein [Jannaschia sp. W003]|uniref:sulfotransferase family protein n=1 Tax=Jannaschia sp. W003 TaxID=2867012 RepID=UPI0021A75330|nr:sulfotransferase family protein [Jannaschia sp. W003]UWQ23177.1 sulfotransferase family protein [Jannaschia sp. W003]